jgi:hypothetical protein
VDLAARQYNISKGEMVRSLTSLGILQTMKARGIKPENYDKLMSSFDKIQKNGKKFDRDQVSIFQDELYYETRKAIETGVDNPKHIHSSATIKNPEDKK